MRADLQALVAQYRAGLDAEMALLHGLQAISTMQREATLTGDLEPLEALGDQRDRVLANLVAIEHEIKPIRLALVACRDQLDEIPGFEEVAALHRSAAALVAGVVTADQHSLDALKEAESARRFAARALEQGESTLAAYRRVVSPPLAGATLVNRKG